jgi:protein phosphatase
MRLEFDYSVHSDVGPVRRDNQDAALATPRLVALADGIGGAPAGDVAAALVLTPFLHLRPDDDEDDPVDVLRSATIEGNRRIARYVKRNPELDGMGTTITAALLLRNEMGLVHAGDSRLYLLRAGVLYQLSRDDSLVQAMVRNGRLSLEEARSHPHRSVILRAITGARPEFAVTNYEIQLGDRLLFCSDGVSDVLDDRELATVLGSAHLSQAAQVLVERAVAAGTRDNATAVVVDVVAGDAGGRQEPRLVGALGARDASG